MVEEVIGSKEILSGQLKGLDLKQLLKTWKEEGVRNSLKTLEVGQWLVAKHNRQLGNEGNFITVN